MTVREVLIVVVIIILILVLFGFAAEGSYPR